MEDSNETQAATDTDAARGKRLPILAITVAIATGIAVWLVPENEKPAPEPTSTTTAAVPQSEAGPDPQSEAPTGVETEVLSVIEAEARPGDQARALIARLRDDTDNAGSAAFAEAERQREAGRTEDAYLLYFFAARQGHGQAALTLGTQSDPAHFSPDNGSLDQADPAQAYKWYRMAVDNGNREAERHLKSLYERVAKQAEAGDEKARRLMLQWR